MTIKEKAPAKAKAEKKVKQGEYTKIIVELNFEAREISGRRVPIPTHLQELFFAKLAAFELDLETILNKYGGQHHES